MKIEFETWQNWLAPMDNYSQYVRDLINKDRLDRLDHKVINNNIREHEEQIKHLKALKGTKQVNENKIQECLETWYQVWKANEDRLAKGGYGRSDSESLGWIKVKVLPELKRLGYRGTPMDVLDKFKNWSD